MRQNKATWILIIVVVIALVFLFAYPRIKSKNGSGISSGVPCLVPNIPLVQHVHPRLEILVDGVPEAVPANIGLTGGCERAIHTHDETGEIHVEAQDRRDYVFSDFMKVWGKTIERPGYAVTVKIDGATNENPEAIPLKDKAQIVVEYRKIGE